jgi:hypothetical protein
MTAAYNEVHLYINPHVLGTTVLKQ